MINLCRLSVVHVLCVCFVAALGIIGYAIARNFLGVKRR